MVMATLLLQQLAIVGLQGVHLRAGSVCRAYTFKPNGNEKNKL